MGIILLVPVLAGSAGAAWVAAGIRRPGRLALAIAGVVGLATLAGAVATTGFVLDRFDLQGAREGRFENWPIVAEAAATYLPLGSGIGSFDAVYRSVEPVNTLDETYFNQAHNDYLETWLEAGWFGAALIIAFLVWFMRRAWTAWRAPASVERDLQLAASIAVSAVLLHSVVDYPLRTETIAVLFAVFCAFLDGAARPDAATQQRDPGRVRRRRTGSEAPTDAAAS
jgi:O-antigen ligase